MIKYSSSPSFSPASCPLLGGRARCVSFKLCAAGSPHVASSFCPGDDGQQNTGSTSCPVRWLDRRHGELSVPPQPPPCVRAGRASVAVRRRRCRRSFLHRRITERLVCRLGGKLEPAAVVWLRYEWR